MAIAGFFPATINAQPGSLDLSFGKGGKVITSIGSTWDEGNAVAIQTDGKIVTAGSCTNWGTSDFALIRCNSNGTLDSTFASGGKVITPVGNHGCNAVAIQNDGKIVVAGSGSSGGINGFALARYTINGRLDSTFGTAGTSIILVGSYNAIGYSLAIQTDGKLVVSGSSYNGTDNDFALIRCTSNGTLDNTFGTGGKVITPIGNAFEYGYSVAIQIDGKIVVAGSSNNGVNHDFALARYNSNGTLDNLFGTGGKLTIPIGSAADEGRSVIVQPDGKILVAGSSINGTTYDFALVRCNGDGTMDNTFGIGGKLTTPIGSADDYARSVMIQTDGKILVAGYSGTVSNYDFALIRYNGDGTVDNTFGIGGKLTTQVGRYDDQGRAAAIQSDGKIVVVGSSGSSNFDCSSVRYSNTGTLDNTYGTGGKFVTPIGDSNDYGRAVAIQADGKILVTGYTNNGPTNSAIALIRYNPDGTLDYSFGSGGKVITDFTLSYDNSLAIAIQTDNKILVGGSSVVVYSQDFALVRYNTDGGLDTTFGIKGKVTTPIGPRPDQARSIAIQTDGKILLAGYSTMDSFTSYGDFSLVRYNANGTLDTTFGVGGKVITDIGNSSNDQGSSVLIQTDGKIVVAGSSYSSSNTNFTLVRYNSDGSLDNTFGTSGKSITMIGNGSNGASAAIQTDGKIVVAGWATTGTGIDFALARYTTNGTLDNTFGTAGKILTDIANSNDYAQSVGIQPDGKIVVAGYYYTSGNFNMEFALARYTTNGILDNTFSTGGKITTPLGNGDDYGRSLAIQTDGKILVAGSSFNGSVFNFALVRYTGDNITEIEEGDSKPSLNIFPNPSRGTFQVNCNTAIIGITVYNIHGECIYQQAGTPSDAQIDLSTQPNGMYVIQVETESGVTNKKITIQK